MYNAYSRSSRIAGRGCDVSYTIPAMPFRHVVSAGGDSEGLLKLSNGRKWATAAITVRNTACLLPAWPHCGPAADSRRQWDVSLCHSPFSSPFNIDRTTFASGHLILLSSAVEWTCGWGGLQKTLRTAKTIAAEVRGIAKQRTKNRRETATVLAAVLSSRCCHWHLLLSYCCYCYTVAVVALSAGW